MVRQVIVVFDWLKSGGLAEEAKVVDRDRFWDDGLKC